MTDVHAAGEFRSAFPERRINAFRPELRAVEGNSGPKHIWGYASMFNKLSRKLGGFVERVDSRAFNASRANGFPDVVCRWNHDDQFLLGTVNARTCLIDVDGTGLLYDVLPPDTTAGRDVVTLMERGDVSSSSFAFRVPDGGDDWGLSDFNYPLRTLLEVDLVDVAPVTTPAYESATSAVRSMDGAVRSLATKFDVEPAEIRSLLEANQGVKLFKRTDRPSVTPITGDTYSTGTSANIVITTSIPQGEPEMTLEEQRLALYEAEVRAKYDAAAMKKMAGSGEAMKNAKGDPSYPIADEDDLHNAIHAVGRGHASHEAIRQHVIARAKALGLSHMLPADWTAADETPAAPDSSDEKNSADEASEKRTGPSVEIQHCAGCGCEERTEAPAEEETETVEERTEAPAGDAAEVTEEVTNGHVVDKGEAQLEKLGLQRRQRIAQLQEKRFDPFLGNGD